MATVTLRPYTAEDVVTLARCDSEYDDFGPHLRDRTVARHPASLDAAGGLVVVSDGKVVGSVSWIPWQHGPNAASACLNMGISLLEPARGKGIGTQAQRQLVDLIFTHTRVHRIEAGTDVTNLAEQRALEKVGFTREGVLRGSQWRLGQYHDMVIYGLLRTDPR